MKIEVTQDDIDSGVGGSLCNGPISFALSRTFTNHLIFVKGDYCETLNELTLVWDFIALPSEVSKWLHNFDHTKRIAGLINDEEREIFGDEEHEPYPVKPITFEIDI
ncbi:hypothetical protein [Rosistilla oblonga]|uniref:hypothetical protein n=1 Tax=Rosistilla oblonga TaxID=2527990 RepID=UPI003A97A90D